MVWLPIALQKQIMIIHHSPLAKAMPPNPGFICLFIFFCDSDFNPPSVHPSHHVYEHKKNAQTNNRPIYYSCYSHCHHYLHYFTSFTLDLNLRKWNAKREHRRVIFN